MWPPLQHVLMKGLLNTPPTFGTDDPAYQGVQALALRLGQRYLDSAFCTWYATGGSTSQTPQLSGFGPGDKGTMFEKYADNSTNGAGGGGEYTVVEGFGWSNGVLIWTADTFGDQLTRPRLRQHHRRPHHAGQEEPRGPECHGTASIRRRLDQKVLTAPRKIKLDI